MGETKNELEDYRAEIDGIDRQMMALFEARMDVAKKIGAYKAARGLAVFDGAREQKVVEARTALLKNKEYEKAARQFLEGVMAVSRSLQAELMPKSEEAPKKTLACYMGVPGSYGEEAARTLFGNDVANTERFEEVFLRVKRGQSEFGVVPVENSSTGSIDEVYELLVAHDLWITGEVNIAANHCLLGVSGARLDDISEVYSHQQGLLQSKAFLKQYPWRQVPFYNTAGAAKFVSECGQKSKAAIASRRAAQLYGLSVLAENVNFGKQNQTRFIAISKAENKKGGNKNSVVFSLKHNAGALYGALSVFDRLGLNLLKIQSMPIVDRLGEYIFFVDFSGTLKEAQNALDALEAKTVSLRFLGNYDSSAT